MSSRLAALGLGLLCCSPSSRRDAGPARIDAARPAVVEADASHRPEPKLAALTLHQAAAGCAAGRIDELLAGGAGVDPRDGEGRTPLHVAAGRCTADLVKRLVAAGADVRAADHDGMTALHEAATPAVSGFGVYAVWTAGSVEVIRFLLAKGADPRAATPTGWTPLHAAAQIPSGGAEVVAALLDGGAPIDARDAHGFTPLHAAARFGAADVARALLQRGAAADARTSAKLTVRSTVYPAGSTPRDVARVAGSRRVVELFEAHGR